MSLLFRGSFGKTSMLISSLSSTAGRDVAVQSPSRGDRHMLQDRGRTLFRTQCEVLFVPMRGETENYADRWAAFKEQANSGKAEVFTHPLDGSFLARIQEFKYDLDAGDEGIRCQVAFLPEEEPEFVFFAGAGAPQTAGVDSVANASAAAEKSMAAAGISSDAASGALATVQGWYEASQLEASQVLLEVGTASQKIDNTIAKTEYATNYAAWDTYKALIRLRYELGRAAESFTAESSSVFDLFVDSATPLLAICSSIYGAALAVDRAAEVARGNRIRTPGLVPAGTTLKMPSP